MKKLLCGLLSLAMGVFVSVPAAAADVLAEQIVSPTMVVQVFNEFEAMEAMSQIPIEELIETGYDEMDIAQIQNYKQRYIDHVKDLDSKTDDVLKAVGYTDEQIEIIRNFHGTDSELRAIGSKVNITARGSLSHDGQYTKGTVYYSWEWSGIPSFKMKDEIAISWNDWECLNDNGVVYYYDKITGASTGRVAQVETDKGNTETEGIAHRFDVAMNDNYYYAKKGSGSFEVRSTVFGPNVKKNMNYYMAYGHSQLNFSGSISFSVGTGGAEGSISFSPSFGTVIAGEKANSWIYCT